MKKLLAFLLAAVFLLSMTACGNTESSKQSSDSSASQSGATDPGDSESSSQTASVPALPQENVDLLVYLQNFSPTVNEEPTEENPTVINSPRNIAKEYMDMYPNVSIEFYYGFNDNFEEEFSLLLNGGTCPDVMFSNSSNFLGSSYMAILTDYLNQPNQYEAGEPIWKDMYYDYMWASAQMSVDAKGNIIGVPYACHVPGTIGLWYNKELFSEYGVDGVPTTWQELCHVALQFKENGITGYAPWAGCASPKPDAWDFWSMLAPALSVGYDALDLDGDDVISVQEDLQAALEGWYYTQNNENVQNMFRLYKYKYDVVLDEGVEGIDYSIPWSEGKVAILEEGLWNVPREASNTKREFDYGIFLHPFVSTDTDITIDGVQVKLDDATKVRVAEKTESGPDRLNVSMCFYCIKPELQNRPEANLAYGVDYLKFITESENLSMVMEEKMGEGIGATRNCRVPGILYDWMRQPFNKTLVGTINVTGFPCGDTSTVRLSLLEQYVKNMITETEFFQQWDAECYANYMEYAEEQEFDASACDIYVPAGVTA